jgi:hypothetical protein
MDFITAINAHISNNLSYAEWRHRRLLVLDGKGAEHRTAAEEKELSRLIDELEDE